MDTDLSRPTRQIQAGACVLFLGAGVSRSSGGPSGQELANELAEQFLGEAAGRLTLGQVCEYVETNHSRKDLEDYLEKRLGELRPQGALLEIPKYQWCAIFTVNFDTLLEQAYQEAKSQVQKLHTLFCDKDNISNIPSGSVPLYKLHGCISRCRMDEARLTLTSDDYAHATRTRSRLFSRLADSLADSTVLYVGFSRDDQDFREVMQKLKEAFTHPEDQRRTYALFPGYREIDTRRWEQEKVALINYDSDQFFQYLADNVSEDERVVPAAGFVRGEAPDILTKLSPTASELIGTLQQNFDFIDSRIHDREANTEEFFRGATPTWGTIAQKVPAKRDIEDDVVQKVLVDDVLDRPKPGFFLITAEAGSGKSTLLRTIAAELSETWDREVLFLQPNGAIEYLSIERFGQLIGRRIYVCVDNATPHAREISAFLSNASRSELKVSLIATARTNEWEDVVQDYYFPSETRFELDLLSRTEIDAILKALKATGNLGLLNGLSYEAQVHAFEALAQKQLLVALREATEGEEFDKIVLNEFEGIPLETAQVAYLAICSLHWLGIPIRVGLLRRLAGIPFSEFADSILTPAKKVIVPYDTLDALDIVYGARHPTIAKIVFWGKVPSESARLDFYRKFFLSIDLGYEADKVAFRQVTRSRNKELLECFATYDSKVEFFSLAKAVDSSDAYIYQHQAMMALAENKVQDALTEIGESLRLHPNDVTIRDTYARALIARGDQQTLATGRMAFAEAENVLKVNISRWPTDPYSYRTLCELYQTLASKSEAPEERISHLRKAYDIVLRGIERCRTRVMLWQKQGQLEQVVGTVQGAREAFQKALGERQSDVVTRLLFAKLEENEERVDDAITLLRDGLTIVSFDTRLRHRLGLLLLRHRPFETADIEANLKAAVTVPTNDYLPRYHLACFLFQTGRYDEAYQHFDQLSEMDIPRSEVFQVRWRLNEQSGEVKDFMGQVANLYYDYGFIRCQFPHDIYFSRWALPSEERQRIRANSQVHFNVGFNIRGPIAINVRSL